MLNEAKCILLLDSAGDPGCLFGSFIYDAEKRDYEAMHRKKSAGNKYIRNFEDRRQKKQELSKPRLAKPLHACVLVTYLVIYLGTYLFTRLLTRYVLQPLLYKLSKIVLI